MEKRLNDAGVAIDKVVSILNDAIAHNISSEADNKVRKEKLGKMFGITNISRMTTDENHPGDKDLEKIAVASNSPWIVDLLKELFETTIDQAEKRIKQVLATDSLRVNSNDYYQVKMRKVIEQYVARKMDAAYFAETIDYSSWEQEKRKCAEAARQTVKMILEDSCDRACKEVDNRIQEEIDVQWPQRFELNLYCTEQKIAIYIIASARESVQKLCRVTGTAVAAKPRPYCKCIGRQEEKQQLRELLCRDGGNVAVVRGANLDGKTMIVDSVLNEMNCDTIYFDYREESSESIISSVRPINSVLYSKIKHKPSHDNGNDGGVKERCFLPYRSLHLRKILCQINTINRHTLIIDHFEGYHTKPLKQVFRQLKEFADEIHINVIVITSKRITANKEISIFVGPLSDEQLEEVFYSENPKEDMTETEINALHGIIHEVRGKVFLVQLIAKWYQKHRNDKAHQKKSLEGLLPQLLEDMKNISLKKIRTDRKFRPVSDGEDLLLRTHIIRTCMDILDDVEKATFLILSCLGGVSMPREYLEKWLVIQPVVIDNLCDKGWCIQGNDGCYVEIRIPQLIAVLSFQAGSKAEETQWRKDEIRIIKRFIHNFEREIRFEESGVIDLGKVNIVINHIHDVLIERCLNTEKLDQADEIVAVLRSFHLSCIRFYLILGIPEPARELLEKTRGRYDLKIDDNCPEIYFLIMWESMLSDTTGEESLKIFNEIDEVLGNLYDNDIPSEEIDWMACRDFTKLYIDIAVLNYERIIEEIHSRARPPFDLNDMVVVTAVLHKLEQYTQLYQKACGFTRRKSSKIVDSTVERYTLLSDILLSAQLIQENSAFKQIGYEDQTVMQLSTERRPGMIQSISDLIVITRSVCVQRQLSRMDVFETVRVLVDCIFCILEVMAVEQPLDKKSLLYYEGNMNDFLLYLIDLLNEYYNILPDLLKLKMHIVNGILKANNLKHFQLNGNVFNSI